MTALAVQRLLLRPARPADLRAVADVHVASYRAAYQGLLPDEYLAELSAGERAQHWGEFLAHRGDRHLTVAEVAGEVVGFSGCGPSTDADADPATGEVYSLYLHPDGWGVGVGRGLLGHTCALLNRDGFREVTLWVLDGNQRGRAFYERQGMRQVDGVRTQELGGREVTDLRYGRPLRAD